jgi:hypothetical protein
VSSAAADSVAYFWSARTPLDGSWRDEIVRFVTPVPGVVLEIVDGEETTVRLSAGDNDPVAFRFARRRGGGTVALTCGAKLVLVSLGVAARLVLELSDRDGEALDVREPPVLPARIPLSECAAEVETLAVEVGLLPAACDWMFFRLQPIAGNTAVSSSPEAFRLATGGFLVSPESAATGLSAKPDRRTPLRSGREGRWQTRSELCLKPPQESEPGNA